MLKIEGFDVDCGKENKDMFLLKGATNGVIAAKESSKMWEASLRLVAEMINARKESDGKELRTIILTPYIGRWRQIVKLTGSDNFRLYSMSDLDFYPVRINPWKIPECFKTEEEKEKWTDDVISMCCTMFGFLQDEVLLKEIKDLFKEIADFLCAKDSGGVCFSAIYKEFLKEEKQAVGYGRVACAEILNRLSCFADEDSFEYRLFGTAEGKSIDEIIGPGITVFEYGAPVVMDDKAYSPYSFRDFMFGTIVNGIYRFAYSGKDEILEKEKYDTLLVVEDADKILTGTDFRRYPVDRFDSWKNRDAESVYRHSWEYGLYMISITQTIAELPASITDYCGFLVVGTTIRREDATVIIPLLICNDFRKKPLWEKQTDMHYRIRELDSEFSSESFLVSTAFPSFKIAGPADTKGPVLITLNSPVTRGVTKEELRNMLG